MGNHKSAEKRNRQTIVKTARNRSLRSELRTTIKNYRVALKENTEGKEELLKKAISKIAKFASKGLIHKKTASRKISRLSTAK